MDYNKFELCCFSSPYVNDKSFKDYAECGFTAVILDWNDGGIGSKKFEEALQYCDKYNIKALPMLLDGKVPNEKEANLKNHKSFDGFFVSDEPKIEQVKACKDLIKDLKREYGEVTYFSNLAPNYFETTKFPPNKSWEGVEDYIVSSCVDLIDDNKGRKIISTDFYPILFKNGEKWLAREWLKHLECFSKIAKKKGYELFLFIMSTGGWHDNVEYERLGLFAGNCEGIDYLRLQGFIDMAYGVTSIGFFTYKDQTTFDCTALVGPKGKHRLYYSAKKAIKEFKFLAKKLDGYDWLCSNTYFSKNPTDYSKEAFVMLNDNHNKFNKLKIEGNSIDLVVGEFYNPKKKKFGYVLSSYVYPNKKARNSIVLSIQGNNATLTNIIKGNTEILNKNLNKIMLLGNNAFFIEIDV